HARPRRPDHLGPARGPWTCGGLFLLDHGSPRSPAHSSRHHSRPRATDPGRSAHPLRVTAVPAILSPRPARLRRPSGARSRLVERHARTRRPRPGAGLHPAAGRQYAVLDGFEPLHLHLHRPLRNRARRPPRLADPHADLGFSGGPRRRPRRLFRLRAHLPRAPAVRGAIMSSLHPIAALRTYPYV